MIESFTVLPDRTLREVFECIGKNAKGIALLVDEGGRLITTVTDGDLRRAILADIHLDEPASVLVERKENGGKLQSVTARSSVGSGDLLGLMEKYGVRQIPIVDDKGKVVSMAFRDVLYAKKGLPDHLPLPPLAECPGEDLGIDAMIMAGGFGKRLYPLTDQMPKPMLPVGDKPMLELIVAQIRSAGIRKIYITTHFMPEVIQKHFGEGGKWDVEIEYIHEDQPLGTGGALGLIPGSDRTLLMMNGDILTHVDLPSLVRSHQESNSSMTVGVRQFDMQVPYGVVRCAEASVERIEEKPLVPFLVNAGIYVVSPEVRALVGAGRRIDMPDLVHEAIDQGSSISAYPIVEYWLDIGRIDDYRQAQTDQKTHQES
ncbi:nucleotidyltransferase family protein [Akkermansiaceae bacterium]|nr:nucleotidyltransferase family protein [Akkermansiaceae bacterium]MDB4311135.1 nucleotidyltransferase family protein [bacterium]MDB4286942.1 nucleotidyltransferase family protein [Akkermansiaceae bacterium]MDB4312428.1 nucleotidyltransferase family protein [bacterium]MDB4313379.1 nucleotidyltransferase family protein [bacterium]